MTDKEKLAHFILTVGFSISFYGKHCQIFFKHHSSAYEVTWFILDFSEIYPGENWQAIKEVFWYECCVFVDLRKSLERPACKPLYSEQWGPELLMLTCIFCVFFSISKMTEICISSDPI